MINLIKRSTPQGNSKMKKTKALLDAQLVMKFERPKDMLFVLLGGYIGPLEIISYAHAPAPSYITPKRENC